MGMFILGFMSAIFLLSILSFMVGRLTDRRARRADPEYRAIFEGRKWHKG